MPKATWNNAVIAEAPDDDVQIVEGNVYFPLTAVKAEYLTPSQTVTQCSWKGSANYYNVSVGGHVNKDAAWTYRAPLDAAKHITNYVAFWKGVRVD